MPQLHKDFDGQTVITTFETSPATAFDLIEALESVYAEVISKQPGFIGAALHMNDARTRICAYSQWVHRTDYQAMLRSAAMRERNRHIHTLCKAFEPVMYEITAVF